VENANTTLMSLVYKEMSKYDYRTYKRL